MLGELEFSQVGGSARLRELGEPPGAWHNHLPLRSTVRTLWVNLVREKVDSTWSIF